MVFTGNVHFTLDVILNDFLSLDSLLSLKMSGFKTFALDWDGCFVSKGAWPHLEVFCQAARRLGFDFSIAEAKDIYLGSKHGIDWYLLMREGLLPRYGKRGMPEEAFSEFRRQVRSCAKDVLRSRLHLIEPLPGARAFLEAASKVFGRDNLIVVTATPESIARIMMRASLLEPFLSERVYGCERLWRPDGRIADKSEKFVWEEPVREAGSRLQETVLVEDGRAGAKFALGSSELGAFVSLSEKFQNEKADNVDMPFWCATNTGDWHSLVQKQ